MSIPSDHAHLQAESDRHRLNLIRVELALYVTPFLLFPPGSMKCETANLQPSRGLTPRGHTKP